MDITKEEKVMKKATGIVRRIDELGRVVIPKEIRKVLKIREGESLEIYTANDGELILKKYSSMPQNLGLIEDIIKSVNDTLGHTVIVCDTQNIIAVSGKNKKEYETSDLVDSFYEFLQKRKSIMKNNDEKSGFIQIIDNATEFYSQAINPILCDGEISGALIMLSYVENVKFSTLEQKVMEITAEFISKQL